MSLLVHINALCYQFLNQKHVSEVRHNETIFIYLQELHQKIHPCSYFMEGKFLIVCWH